MRNPSIFRPLRTAAAVGVVAFAASFAPARAGDVTPVGNIPPCSAAEIRLTSNGADGTFDGMSHAGARLILANAAESACTVPAFVTVRFRDSTGATTTVGTQTMTPFDGPLVDGKRLPMGHGPVAFPLVLQPHASASTVLRWVEAPVFTHSVCVDTAFVAVTIAGKPVTTPMQAHVCGPDAAQVTVTVGRLAHGTTATQ